MGGLGSKQGKADFLDTLVPSISSLGANTQGKRNASPATERTWVTDKFLKEDASSKLCICRHDVGYAFADSGLLEWEGANSEFAHTPATSLGLPMKVHKSSGFGQIGGLTTWHSGCLRAPHSIFLARSQLFLVVLYFKNKLIFYNCKCLDCFGPDRNCLEANSLGQPGRLFPDKCILLIRDPFAF